jgi:hypothetical protein
MSGTAREQGEGRPESSSTDGGVVDDSTRQQLRAVRVDHRDVRALAVQVDADGIHLWVSSDPGNSVRPTA